MNRKWTLVGLLGLIAVIIAGILAWRFTMNADALRDIVMGQCMVNQRQHGSPAPCREVNLAAGYALMKDRNGVRQYLLLPTAPLTGIESAELGQPTTANYFWLAWQAREATGLSGPAADRQLSLTLNSEWGRSQNLLHIHISCLRPDIRASLDRYGSQMTGQWAPFPVSLRGHEYLARTLTMQELAQVSPIMLLDEGVAGARAQRGHYGLALARLPDGRFILLATERNLLQLNLASAEELQDHRCPLAQ